MRTIEYGTTTTSTSTAHVPAFLTKLWKLVTDVACNELICWSLAGTSFIIFDEIRFSKELLPLYFKHNNMASFVRQLNMYGFRKLSCIDQGGMHCYKSEIEFYHQYFIKGQEKLLELIKRKIPHSKSEEPKVKQEYIDELISNIKTLKGKQDCAEQGMRHLKRENRMLWRHVHLLTDRYSKQQAVIQELFPYFLGIIRSRQDAPLKRKALPETETHNKIARISPPYYVQEDSNSCMPSSPGNVSNRGPVIHEVTEMETNKMFPGTVFCSPNTTATKECEGIVGSPLSCSLESSEQNIDSPYTDPGSMKTFNILNQNYERRSRSNSLSPNMGMRRSPMHASTASLRLPSPGSVPGASNSMPCFATASSSFASSSSTFTSTSTIPSSSVVIDETTSDVPVSPLADGLMRSPFLPKIEESCTDSGMYSMDSMINDRVSSIINEEAVSMLEGRASSMMGSTSPLVNNGVHESSLINNGVPESSGNKLPPTSFMSNIKSDIPEMNWPQSYATEPSLENWLGQIFKSDNLTAGCSLPQHHQQSQEQSANYV